MMQKTIFTLGHSTQTHEEFIALLRRHAVNAVCDVRSVPFSKYTPQFNQDNLKKILSDNHIQYVFLGKELGARPDDRNCYKNNKVQFEYLAKTDLFQKGITRVIKGTEKFNIALVCAEKDPTECHRTLLIARTLETKGFLIAHILENGEIETQDELIKKIIKETNKGQECDLFLTQDEIRTQAYTEQTIKIIG
jgi:uncharacterized protein (DUF488 family)